MKESQLYLNFFRKFALVIGLLGLLGVLGGYYIAKETPHFYRQSRMFQISYLLDNITEKVQLADEAVTELRQEVRQPLDIFSPVQTSIYKPGPLSIEIRVNSTNPKLNEDQLNRLANYLTAHFEVKQLGVDVYGPSEDSNLWNFWIKILLGGFAGIGLGLVTSLVISYFKNY